MKCIVDGLSILNFPYCLYYLRHSLDVLTMSKLDSGLLIMTPVDVQPEVIAQHAVKMFEGEAKSADVSLNFQLEDSWHKFNGDWISLDPTRLLQILIVGVPPYICLSNS
jgi:signal transduction histidine kinase